MVHILSNLITIRAHGRLQCYIQLLWHKEMSVMMTHTGVIWLTSLTPQVNMGHPSSRKHLHNSVWNNCSIMQLTAKHISPEPVCITCAQATSEGF